MSLLQMSPYARLMMDVRMGQVGSLAHFLQQNPTKINDKIKTGPKTLESFLQLACRFDQPNVANWLITQGAVETPASSPDLLHHAVVGGNITLVRYCLHQGFDPWAIWTNHDGKPMHHAFAQATAFCRLDVLEALRKMGAGLNKKDENGENLLHALMRSASGQAGMDRIYNTADFLINHGVRLDQKNDEGVYPHQLCAYPEVGKKVLRMWQEYAAAQQKKDLLAATDLSSAQAPAKAKKM